jgi:uncharacterized membrane protein YdcZ (DUF606 family)
MMLVITSIAVALVVFILYALERKSKDQPINWIDAGKLTIFGGLLSSGVVFATTGEIPDVVETVTKVVIPAVQDMFVGIPTF